ncbi:MAG: hypothetical protein MZV70_28660 [Desulfobacterales bacterium]|nr:hypothetical protein [Desulfobacterales bacterium]
MVTVLILAWFPFQSSSGQRRHGRQHPRRLHHPACSESNRRAQAAVTGAAGLFLRAPIRQGAMSPISGREPEYKKLAKIYTPAVCGYGTGDRMPGAPRASARYPGLGRLRDGICENRLNRLPGEDGSRGRTLSIERAS